MNWLMRRPIFLYDADDGGSGAAGDPTPAAAAETPPAVQAPPAPTGGDTPGEKPPLVEAPPGGARPAHPLQLTQDQLSERLERAKRTEREALLKVLGVESADAAKALLEAGQKALDDKKTAEERQAEALQKALAEADALKRQAAAAQVERDRAAIKAAAMEKMAGKFIDPGAAFKLLEADQLTLEGGKVIGLDEAIQQLATQYPWTVRPEAPAPKKIEPKVVTNPEGGPPPKETDAERAARYFGGVASNGFFNGGGVRLDGAKQPKP